MLIQKKKKRMGNVMGATTSTQKHQNKTNMHLPGIEPRANAWKAFMLPLHQRCSISHTV